MRRLGFLLGLSTVALLLAQAPKPGTGNPTTGYGAPAGTIFVRTGTTTVANTAAETLLLGSGVGSTTIAGGVLYPGRMIRFEQRGVLSTTGNPTLRYRIKVNGTDIIDTGATTMPGVPVNANFIMQTDLTCLTAGTNGSVIASGGLTFQTTQGQLTIACNWAPIQTTVIDTTATITFNSSVQWGTASPSNTISVMMGDVRIFN